MQKRKTSKLAYLNCFIFYHGWKVAGSRGNAGQVLWGGTR